MAIAPFGILAGLLVLGLLVAGVVLLIVFLRNKRLLWVLGVVGAIAAVLVAVAGMHFLAVPRMAYREMKARDAATEVRTATVVAERAAAPADTSAFLADVYPSATQAARAVAAQSARSVASVCDDGPLPVLRVKGRAPIEMLEQAAEVFRSDAPVQKVEVSAAAATATTQPGRGSEVFFGLRVDGGDEGVIQAVLSGPKGQVTRSARFVSKPWAANFAQFLSESSQNRILAQSRRLCPSFPEADQAAQDDAAGQLLAHFRDSIVRGVAARRLPSAGRPDQNELRRLIRVELQRGNLVSDRFTQRFRRPYGDVWRQSLLVDCSPEVVDRLAAGMVSQTAGHRSVVVSGWVRIAVSIGGLALLIFVLYLVLNAATKGYYVWVLRVAAAALVAAGTIAVLYAASDIDRLFTSLEVLR
ncbi:MAG: hypothetical protein WBF17_13185 [Phycisphaerae bacterium]